MSEHPVRRGLKGAVVTSACARRLLRTHSLTPLQRNTDGTPMFARADVLAVLAERDRLKRLRAKWWRCDG